MIKVSKVQKKKLTSGELQDALGGGETSLNFLVVDDDEAIANAVSNMLKKAGAKVQTVNTPEEALAISANSSIDVLFTDLVMKDSDGLELMANVRRNDSSVGVVVMTSHAAPDIPQKAASQGANGFLRKPFKHNECVTEAIKALNHRREKLGLELLEDS